MPLIKIECEIDIPDGYEFDRIAKCGENLQELCHQEIILRKKKPKSEWIRVFTYLNEKEKVCAGYYTSLVHPKHSRPIIEKHFMEWLTPWIEYSTELKDKG